MQAGIGFDEQRVSCNCLFGVAHGFAEHTLLEIGSAAVGVEHRNSWVFFDGLSVALNSIFEHIVTEGGVALLLLCFPQRHLVGHSE